MVSLEPSLCQWHLPLFPLCCDLGCKFFVRVPYLAGTLVCSMCIIFFSPPPPPYRHHHPSYSLCTTSPSPPPPLVPDCPLLIVLSRCGWQQRSIGRWHLLSEPWQGRRTGGLQAGAARQYVAARCSSVFIVEGPFRTQLLCTLCQSGQWKLKKWRQESNMPIGAPGPPKQK